ncbi:SDR family NAD(P)-dependent oxidoreductase, partial [Streptomyces sp. SID8455]|nr:SDR family NAD(P)-dependent oxidoreductase [Streptomyces sp. SID8455]
MSTTTPTTPSAEFDGRVALVTGGASGIGLAVARLLATAGAAVVVADHDEENARKAAAQLESTGARAAAVAMDVTDPASVEAGVRFT